MSRKRRIQIHIEGGETRAEPHLARLERDLEKIERAEVLGSVLYRVADRPEKIDALERRVRRARYGFVAHAITFGGVAAFGSVAALPIALLAAPAVPVPFPALGIGMLAWLTGLSVHAVSALIAAPRALRAHRALWELRQEQAPAAATEGGATLLEEIRANARAAREKLAALERPRLDLEATLVVAEREAERLARALAEVDAALARPTTRRADANRLTALRAERQRIATLLERLRVTTANVEIDAILIANQPAAHAYSAEGLETEAELLRAAVEAAKRAEATVLGEGAAAEAERRGRSGRRER